MKYFPAVLALTVLPVLFAQIPGSAPKADVSKGDPSKVILTINNEKITAGEYDEIINSLPEQYRAYARGAGRRAFAEQLIQLKLLAADAEKQKLDQDPKVEAQLAFSRQDLLARVMFQNLQDNVKVDDAAIQNYYDAHKADYEVVKARHILIRVKGAPMPAAAGKPELSDEEAKAKADAIRKRVVGGEDFATVAKAESDDSGSGAQGGELGEFKKGMMVPPFEQAAFAAKVGDITEPVKSPFGYHIILVESHSTKPLSEVRADIVTKLKPETARKIVDGMRKDAKVDIDDGFFGPAVGAPGAAPSALK